MIRSFFRQLSHPVDARPLEIFQVLFGVVVALQVYSFLESDYIRTGILLPVTRFTYDWFPFIRPLPSAGMKLVLALTLVAPILIALNKFTRVAAAIYLVAFSYLFLLEESYYNNHFYFIILLTGFFLFYSPAGDRGKKTVPGWLLLLFQFQVVVVYFYGGVAKLNADWVVNQQPVRALLAANAPQSPFPALTASEFAVWFIAYGGLAFDLAIGFLLWIRKTFRTAVWLTVIFHGTNFWIFNMGEGGTIGIFPLLMIAANVLFAQPDSLRKWHAKLLPTGGRKQAGPKSPTRAVTKAVPWLVWVFMAVQVLVPLRHWAVPGPVDWTGQQQWFSWRMKVSSRQSTAKFILRRFEGDEPAIVEPGRMINSMQLNMMTQHADMVYKFVQYLKSDLKERMNIDTAIINAEILVEFNGRPAQYFVDPERDLFDIEYEPCGPNDWILDLKD